MYETIRIVNKLKPKYVIWENVKNLLSEKHRHNFDNYINQMEELGYNSYYQVLNSKDYGIPQNRERVFTISIREDIDKGYTFPSKEELKLRLKDMLEDEVDEKYYLNEEIVSKFISVNESGNVIGKLNMDKWQDSTKRIYDTNKYAPTINTMQDGNLEPKILVERDSMGVVTINTKPRLVGGIGDINFGNQYRQGNRIYDSSCVAMALTASPIGNVGGSSYLYKINNLRIRKLTPLECWRLQGFDDEDFYKAKERLNNVFYKGRDNSNSQLYKQAGNSITVNVLEKIFNNLF